MPLQQLFTSRKPYTATNYVAHHGKVFYDEDTGALRIGDGITPGGSLISYPLASSSTIGGVKLGPGVDLNPEGQIIINPAGLDFSFGDFYAFTNTGTNDGACLSSVNTNQDVNIVSNGSGMINVVGAFHVHKTNNTVQGALEVDPIFEVNADGQTFIRVPTTDTLLGAVEIIGSSTGDSIAPGLTGAMLHITGQLGLQNRLYFDGNGAYVAINGRRWNGSIATGTTAVLAGDDVLRINATAETSAGMPSTATVQIRMYALENQTPTTQGGAIDFIATPIGQPATTRLTAATITSTGTRSIRFFGPLSGNADTATTSSYTQSFNTSTLVAHAVQANTVVNSAQPTITSVGTLTNLSIATGGTLTTPKILINDGGIRTVNGGTACTIDFSVDSIILWTAPSGTANITLSNYTAGATVKLIIAMTTSRDINFGVDANANSSTGADAWNGAGAGAVDISNTAVHLTYTCVGSTAATTYVQVVAN